MPANIIKINDVSEFYMGDSKMPALIKFLKDNGFPENRRARVLSGYEVMEQCSEIYHRCMLRAMREKRENIPDNR